MKKQLIELDKEKDMEKTSFKNKLAFKGRKIAISLKRNFYIVPLIVVLITAAQFLCILYILSPMYARVSTTLTPWGSFNCIFLFLITLFCILYSIAYLNYAMKKYGKKRPIHMLIIYYVLAIINVVLLVLIFVSNEKNIADEYNNMINGSDASAREIAKEYYEMGLKSESALIWQFILAGVSLVIVSVAPLIQSILSKIKFKKISEDGKEETN